MKAKKKCPTCGGDVKPGSTYCCYPCSFPAIREAIVQLKKKEGPIYEKWKTRREASLGRL